LVGQSVGLAWFDWLVGLVWFGWFVWCGLVGMHAYLIEEHQFIQTLPTIC
jgi:hypothetical protein